MKIAVIYNRESRNVINLFGIPNREKYGKKGIRRIVESLKKFGHQVKTFEGDKDLIRNLEEFMPRVLKGERPGMAFNLSYGVQGQARYTHVPGILEMVGIPYVGSGPLAHSLALDKVVAKVIFRQNGLPTPDFAVLNDPDFPSPDLEYPLIIKPKNEAVSMGIKIVNNEGELREAAQVIFDKFNQAVLLEKYIEGREINVGLIGNNPPEAFLPCEILFGEGGPAIYTIKDKKGTSGREIRWVCPAPIGEELTRKVQEISINAFSALGCYDCARVDMRLDKKGTPYILEINSLPSLGEHGSYTIAAKEAGIDFPDLINRLVETASARYFGTPKPPDIQKKQKDLKQEIFLFITQRRDEIERCLEDWTAVSSRTTDPVGIRMAMDRMDKRLQQIKMQQVEEFTDNRSVWTWQTKAGIQGGTLFIGHMDIPLEPHIPSQMFRRDPEWLYGEGIGISRAPLVSLEYALRSLRSRRILQKIPLGVLYYMDEGRDARYSAETIQEAAKKVKQVLILRPGGPQHHAVVQRRGQRKYRLTIEGVPHRLGKALKGPEVLLWTTKMIEEISKLNSRKDRLSISTIDIETEAFPMLLPHRIIATVLMSFLDPKLADKTENQIREWLKGAGFRTSLERVADRPPMKDRQINSRLGKALSSVADEWDIPFPTESSLWPSVGGLVPAKTPVICGIGPAARDLYTPQESVNRTSLIQRTILLAEFLAKGMGGKSSGKK
jgi:D-alanine-D-alanine ligase